MASFSDMWADTKRAWNDSSSSDSPGARFGLLFDPTAYALDAVGYGDKYRDLVKGSGDWANTRLSGMLGTRGGNGWVANKPASTIGLLAAGYFGGGALAGGGGGAGASGNLGIFSNGGTAGMSGVGGGNAGALAASHGISGGAGIGSATGGGGFLGSLQQNPQQYMQLAQQMQGQPQQQQQRPLQPVVIKGRVYWL